MRRFRIALVSSVLVALSVGCDESPSSDLPSSEPPSTTLSTTPSAVVSTKTPRNDAGGSGASAREAPAASASPSAAPSASAHAKRPKKPRCAKGAYLHEEPKFCIRVPDGYTPSSAKSGGVMDSVLFQSAAPGSMDLTVTWIQRPRSVYVEERNELKAAVAAADGEIMNTRDDRGLYGRYEREVGGQPVVYGESVTYKRGFIFWCKAQAFKKPKPPHGFLTACQTLMAR